MSELSPRIYQPRKLWLVFCTCEAWASVSPPLSGWASRQKPLSHCVICWIQSRSKRMKHMKSHTDNTIFLPVCIYNIGIIYHCIRYVRICIYSMQPWHKSPFTMTTQLTVHLCEFQSCRSCWRYAVRILVGSFSPSLRPSTAKASDNFIAEGLKLPVHSCDTFFQSWNSSECSVLKKDTKSKLLDTN